MSDIIKYENTFKTRFKRFLKSKTAKISIVIIVLFVTVASILLLLPKKADKQITYKTIDDLLNSQVDPNKVNELDEFRKADNYFQKGDYKEAIDLSRGVINKGVNSDMLSGFYGIIYTSYLKLDDLPSAINTIKDYQKTDAYKKIPQDSTNYWDSDLEKLNQGINPQEEREKLENAL